MPSLDEKERQERRKAYSGRWMPHSPFPSKRQGTCQGCARPIQEGQLACYARWEGVGIDSRIIHPHCVDRLPPKT